MVTDGTSCVIILPAMPLAWRADTVPAGASEMAPQAQGMPEAGADRDDASVASMRNPLSDLTINQWRPLTKTRKLSVENSEIGTHAYTAAQRTAVPFLSAGPRCRVTVLSAHQLSNSRQ